MHSDGIVNCPVHVLFLFPYKTIFQNKDLGGWILFRIICNIKLISFFLTMMIPRRIAVARAPSSKTNHTLQSITASSEVNLNL